MILPSAATEGETESDVFAPNCQENIAICSTTCAPKDRCACIALQSRASSTPSIESAMHDAYEAAPILEKLPLNIESLACYGDTLLVGTKQGHLLVYSVHRSHAHSETHFDVSLERSNRSFSKKPITQLAVVPEYHILVSLSDGVISVHDLTVYAHITTINKTRGATLFAVDLQEQKVASGDVQYVLHMCVAVKRKLQLLFWKNRDFHELGPDLAVPDIPKAMEWCNDSLCVGFKREFYIIKIEGGRLKELFPTGSHMEPTVARIDDNVLALGRDETTIFIDSEGEPTQTYGLTWSDIPLAMVHHFPYIIAVLPKCIEMRTIEGRKLIQALELLKPRLICISGSQVYVASANYVWRLAPVAITAQVKQLLQSKEFELALMLANMTDEPALEKKRRIQHIRNLYAFDLFSMHRFEDSLKIFHELGTDPSHVIGLYPSLLPPDYRNLLEYPDRLPQLEGVDLEKGYLALIEYLTQQRNEVLKDIGKEMSPSAIVEGNTTIKSKKQLSQIIDTTLLKCYVQTNDALVAPLLRLKDNNCHIDESERVLKKNHKYSELIILYERKNLHRKALDLMLRQSQKANSTLKGCDPTVEYLQRLGSEHLPLIFDYAAWVLQASPEEGLKIFTEDMAEVEALPREDVLNYLERRFKSNVIPYLEHVIHIWEDKSPEFHNVLAIEYKEQICDPMAAYLNALPEGQQPVAPGKEPGILGEVRSKLLYFLEVSAHYMPERLLAHFPQDGFFHERALLLGRVGRHEQALALYVHVIHDSDLAEQYCKRNYDPNKAGNCDVFYFLLKMYLHNPDPATLGVIALYNRNFTEPNVEKAHILLEDHGNKIDTRKALELLPSTTKIDTLLMFLENMLADRAGKRRSAQVLRSLYYAEHLQVQEQRMYYQKMKSIVTEENTCRVCKKRIGNSAFARYPDGEIVHYFCCKDPKIVP